MGTAEEEQAEWTSLLDQSAAKRARRLLSVDYPASWEAPIGRGLSLRSVPKGSAEYKRVEKLTIRSQDHPPHSGKLYVQGRLKVGGFMRLLC